MKIKNVIFEKEKLFFTSDDHLFHKNIITYCDRPFVDVDEMNSNLIKNWNSVVPKDGKVFNLGDVSLTANPKELYDVLQQLNGEIHLVVGNHEHDALGKPFIRERWASINDVAEIFVDDEEITYGKQHIVMCHYPMIVWNGSHRGSWQLFGHVHGGLSNKGVIKHPVTSLDVGVDSHNYTPWSYQEVKEQITKQALGNESKQEWCPRA
jgi:calcineurin-like phosphoesterase family protein